FAVTKRNLHYAIVRKLRELRVIAHGNRLAGFERADQRPRSLPRTRITKIHEPIDRSKVRGKLVVRNVAGEGDAIAAKRVDINIRRRLADDQKAQVLIARSRVRKCRQHNFGTFGRGEKSEET